MMKSCWTCGEKFNPNFSLDREFCLPCSMRQHYPEDPEDFIEFFDNFIKGLQLFVIFMIAAFLIYMF